MVNEGGACCDLGFALGPLALERALHLGPEEINAVDA